MRSARRTTIAVLFLLSVAAMGCGGDGNDVEGNGNGVQGGIAAPQPEWQESFEVFSNYEPDEDALINAVGHYNQTFADKLGACGGRQSDVDWIHGAIENFQQFGKRVDMFDPEEVVTPQAGDRPPILAKLVYYGGDYTLELTECEQLDEVASPTS